MTHYACEPAGIFLPQEYELPESVKGVASMLKMKDTVSFWKQISATSEVLYCNLFFVLTFRAYDAMFFFQIMMEPFLIHVFFMSIFAR